MSLFKVANRSVGGMNGEVQIGISYFQVKYIPKNVFEKRMSQNWHIIKEDLFIRKLKNILKFWIMDVIRVTSVWGDNLDSNTFMDGENGW